MTRVPDQLGLRLLVGVAAHGSIGAAARELGITQQSASERLRGIEARTGLSLLRRTPRGSELTPAGVVVSGWAARLVALSDEIDVAIDGLRGERDRDLVVWASMTVAESLVPAWLVRLRRRQLAEGREPSAVSLTAANSHDVEEAVRSGAARVGFVEGVQAPGGLRSAAVAEDELVLVATPDDPLARRRQALAPGEVSGLTLSSRERGSGTREVLERALAALDLPTPAAAVELTTATAVREAVLAGSPPAFLSRRVVERDLDAARLVVVPTGLRLRRLFRAVWAGSAEPPAGPVRELVAIARQR